MQKAILFVSFLLALALPVLAVDALGCEANRDCVVSANTFINSGQVFNYRTFTLTPAATIVVRPQPIGPAGLSRGGSITIFARQLYLSGIINANGQDGGPRFSLTSGQTGGEVHLFARDSLELARTGRISVAGGRGSWLGCDIGNGGSGGHVEIGIVPGAWVSNSSLFTYIVEGGAGSPVPAGCAGRLAGAKGPNGSVEFVSFIPSAARMAIAGGRIRELPVGSESPISVSLVDDFNAPITESVNFASSNATVLSVEQTGPTTALVRVLAPGSAHVAITLNRAGIAEGRVYFTGFSRGATDFNIIGNETRTLVVGGNNTVTVTLVNRLLGGETPTGSIEWSVDHPEVLEITEQSATRAVVRAVGAGNARLVARLQLEDGTFVEKDVVYSVLPAVGRVVITGAEVRAVRAGVDNAVSIEVYDPLGRRVDVASVNWEISNESVIQLASQTVRGGFVTGAVFRGLTRGSATVTATVGTTSDSITYNVQPGVFDHIEVRQVDLFGVTQLEYSEVVPESRSPQIIGRDALGNVVPIPDFALRNLRIEQTRDSVGNLSIVVRPALPPLTQPSAEVLVGGGSMDIGSYTYKVTFVSPTGESVASQASNVATITNPAFNGRVMVSNIPISTDASVTSRRIYRSKFAAGAEGPWLYVATIADNRASTFVDDTPNARLGAAVAPTSVDSVRVRVIAGTKPGPVTLRITYNEQTFDIFYNVVMPLRSAVALSVSPSTATLEAGSDASFTVVAVDSRGNAIPVTGVQWVVSNGSGSGVIDQNGMFTALHVGSVTVSAFLPGTSLQGGSFVTVVQSSANHVVLTGPFVATTGEAAQYNAYLADRAGNVLQSVNGEAVQFIWSTTSGQIYQNGTFVPSVVGSAVVRATVANLPSISASRSVTVLANPFPTLPATLRVVMSGPYVATAGHPVQFSAYVADRDGRALQIANGEPVQFVWAASSGQISYGDCATIPTVQLPPATQPEGTQPAPQPVPPAPATPTPQPRVQVLNGPAPVSVADNAQVLAGPAPVSVADNVQVLAGPAPVYVAVLAMHDGRAAGNGAVICFQPTQAGEVTLTAYLASDSSVFATRVISIAPGAISSLRIVEDGAETPAGVQRQLTAVWTDRYGNTVIAATGVSWAITGGSGTAVLSGNRFTGRKAGDVAIEARASNEATTSTAAATIYVVAGSAARFTLKPSTAVIRAGDSVRFTVSNAFDNYGNAVSNASASWRVSDSSIGSVSSSGVFTAQNSGIVTVYATLGGTEQSSDVQVLAALRGRSARLSTSQPITGVTSSGVQVEQPITTVNSAPASGLSGFFTVAGLGEGDSVLLLVIGLAALVIALGVYVYSTRDSGL